MKNLQAYAIRLFIAVILQVVIGCVATQEKVPPLKTSENYSSKKRVFGKKVEDWELNFYSSCPLPNYKSVQWIKEKNREFLRFTMKDGDIGGCSIDRMKRDGGPNWERAELKQGTNFKNKIYLSKTEKYTIEWKMGFIKGFTTEYESIFQLYQYTKECNAKRKRSYILNNEVYPGVYPLLMIQTIDGKIFKQKILSLIEKWLDMRIEIDFVSGEYSLFLG